MNTRDRVFTLERDTDGFHVYTTPLSPGRVGVFYLPKSVVREAPAFFKSYVGTDNSKLSNEVKRLHDENARLKSRLDQIDALLIEARRIT